MLNILGRRNIIASLVLALLFLTSATKSVAQQLIHHPTAGEGQEVLYWHTFNVSSLPTSSTMYLSTQGYCIAYLNGRIVMPSVVWPYRSDDIKGIATTQIDVTQLIQRGENIITICNAPFKGANGVGVVINAVDANGRERILCQTESDWICRPASGNIISNGEDVDGTEYYKHWERCNTVKWDCKWVGAEAVEGDLNYWTSIGDYSMKSVGITRPSFSEKTDTTLTYFFPSTVEGQLRITLRGLSYGQVLDISGMKYKSNGTTDEQFITRFSLVKADSIVICNLTKKNKLPNVQSVEVLKQKELWMRK